MVRPAIRNMSAYKPPLEGRSDGGFLLLDFNERTTPVSPQIRRALIDFIQTDRLQVYPEYGDFVSKLADYLNLDSRQLMITNGSDQGIDLIYRAAAEPGDEAIVPVPTFPMLTHSAEVGGLQLKKPCYTADYQYPLDEVLSLVNERTRVIVVCNPNSPTGTLLRSPEILRLAAYAPHAAILVDECYYEYSRETVKDSVGEYPNIFITRTFSKTWGLPSLRMGYLISSEANIDHLLKVRGPYDVNRLAVVAASAALEDPSYMEEYVKEVMEVSKPMFTAFLERKGIRYWPSATNFVLVYPPDDKLLVKNLRQKGILVRPRHGPGIEGTVRITLGTREDTEKVIAELDEIL